VNGRLGRAKAARSTSSGQACAAWRNRSANRVTGDDDPEKVEAPPAVIEGDVTISVTTIRRWLRGERARLFGLQFSIDVNGDDA